MTILPMHEFLLWNNCNNNCKFCWQRKDKQSTVDEQLEAISLTIDYIKDFKEFSYFSYWWRNFFRGKYTS